ncbi:hypothetical protein AACH06_11470 [Ideonella sp. DXS29W]|uniref:Uncharacterized protein n=1 Tax=Ideonella lacteola TaxID=2984193 RepID=A0ABU9BSG1_9BURK
MATLMLDAGRYTEDLLAFLTNELDNEILDQIEIERRNLKSEKLATEPVTVAATLTLATTAVVVVGRIIERWLENRRQLDQLRVVANGFNQSDEAGRALAALGKENAKVAVTYGMPSTQRQREK